jgi:hypothetical protein
MLPLWRYVRGAPARFMAMVIVVGTAFPVATGLGAARDAVSGPAWQSVTIGDLDHIGFEKKGGKKETTNTRVELTDGRSLSATPGLGLKRGPAKVLVLRGIGRIIDVAR